MPKKEEHLEELLEDILKEIRKSLKSISREQNELEVLLEQNAQLLRQILGI